MISTFTWLDYSEHDRRRMLDVINLFRERETRDELGIGSIRDAFADLLFPGTSTIQTRARYFLFIPWIYRRLESDGVSPMDFDRVARQREVELIKELAASGESEGVIGIEAGKELKRLPSSIYWQGLEVWRIRLFHGSQEQYFRSLHGYYAARRRPQRNDDREPVEGRVPENWHPGLPPAPDDFPRGASFRLTEAEGRYLRERIILSVPQSLLALLVAGDHAPAAVEFPWILPNSGAFPPAIKEQLEHARNFSEVIYGAVLLYNLMLAEKAQAEGLRRDDLAVEYRRRLDHWFAGIAARASALDDWDHNRFWAIVDTQPHNVTTRTHRFVDDWIDAVRAATSPGTLADNATVRATLRERERQLKGNLARLENRRALELWSGAAGLAPLSYRWPVAQRMVSDILRGIAGVPSHA